MKSNHYYIVSKKTRRSLSLNKFSLMSVGFIDMRHFNFLLCSLLLLFFSPPPPFFLFQLPCNLKILPKSLMRRGLTAVYQKFSSFFSEGVKEAQ